MVLNSVTDQARVAMAAMGQTGRAAVKHVLKSSLSRLIAGPPSAHHLLLVPQDLRTADPSFAAECYDGYFGLAGAVALTGSESPFSIPPPSKPWQKELYAFSWLRHLSAAQDGAAREKARALISEWMALGRKAPALAWETDIVTRRVIALLSHAGFVLDGVDAAFYDAVMRSLTRELHRLAVSYGDAGHSVARLRALTALLLAGLCIAEQQTYLNAYLTTFCNELNKQILPDGGHISRNPGNLAELLFDLLPLKQCFLSRAQEPPEALYAAIGRMLPAIRRMRLGDGGLARFNGMGATRLDSLGIVLAYDDDPRGPVTHSHCSGYYRLECGDTIVIMDGAGPPPFLCSGKAHAGCLSFEMSSGSEPVIVNCGAPRDDESEWAVVCRSTAAHSTLTINDLSSARLVKKQGLAASSASYLLASPKTVRTEMAEEAGHQILRAAHSGYKDRFGFLHRRKLRLLGNGSALEGVDQLTGASTKGGDAVFAIRFHLHPRVSAIKTAEENTLLLGLANGETWELSAQGAKAVIEESIFLADPICHKRSLQIVLTGKCTAETQVSWVLKKMDRARRQLRAVPGGQG